MHLTDLRREYMRAGLSEADADPDAFGQFERWFKDALAADLLLPDAMTLATVSASGAPNARVVLLKGVDHGGFVFYTNYDSRKGEELAARPQACMVFLWIPLERQVRVEGRVEKVSAQESDRYFATRPPGSRLSAWASAQSRTIAGREALENALAEAEKRFGENPPRPPNWGGYRLIPESIEFWQGRANRLHDRLLYRRSRGAWKIERLAP